MRLLSPTDLKAKGIDFSRSQLIELMNRHGFPRPIKLGLRRNAWVESEVDAWIQTRVDERDKGQE